MVNLKIDHNEISVPEGTTIMEAAALAGIDIRKRAAGNLLQQ